MIDLRMALMAWISKSNPWLEAPRADPVTSATLFVKTRRATAADSEKPSVERLLV
jgi:hypothetical protein